MMHNQNTSYISGPHTKQAKTPIKMNPRVLWLITMITFIALGCNPSQDQANTEAASQNKILPNPNKEYSDQCYALACDFTFDMPVK